MQFDGQLGPVALISHVIAAVAAILLTAILIIPPQSEQGEHITVLAAASMQNALDEVNAAFTKSTGVKVTARYAASSALIKQIAQGAEADVFVSADFDWMDFGSKKKLIKDATRVNLLGNQLVLIAQKDSKPRHSITSSARCWRIQGTSRPSALAVLRLTISWNLVGA